VKRITATLVVLALLIAACGGDDAGSDDTTATTAAGTSSTTATTEASTTTAAETTTTTEAETTTTTEALSGPDAFIAMSADNVGEYTGRWDNATFGSSGDLYINVLEANTEAGFVLIQVDVDGFAFGAEDPDLFVVEISTAGEGFFVGFTSFLGSDAVFEPDLENGTFTLVAEPPLLGGMTLEIEGTMTPDGFSGTYVIPGLADGSWGVEPA
jgi:hypothetical protein